MHSILPFLVGIVLGLAAVWAWTQLAALRASTLTEAKTAEKDVKTAEKDVKTAVIDAEAEATKVKAAL